MKRPLTHYKCTTEKIGRKWATTFSSSRKHTTTKTRIMLESPATYTLYTHTYIHIHTHSCKHSVARACGSARTTLVKAHTRKRKVTVTHLSAAVGVTASRNGPTMQRNRSRAANTHSWVMLDGYERQRSVRGDDTNATKPRGVRLGSFKWIPTGGVSTRNRRPRNSVISGPSCLVGQGPAGRRGTRGGSFFLSLLFSCYQYEPFASTASFAETYARVCVCVRTYVWFALTGLAAWSRSQRYVPGHFLSPQLMVHHGFTSLFRCGDYTPPVSGAGHVPLHPPFVRPCRTGRSLIGDTRAADGKKQR